MALSQRDWERLAGVNPRLVALMGAASKCSAYQFGISEGIRTKKRQAEMVAKGASQTMASKHLTGKAIDVYLIENGHVTWDFDAYRRFADHIKSIAAAMDIDIVWGGDWRTLRDGPHFELR